MQPSKFKDLLVAHCDAIKIPFEISDSELTITMDDAINQQKLTLMCDSWYSDHATRKMVFKFNTDTVYKMTKGEFETYSDIVSKLPAAMITAQYGVKNVNERNIGRKSGTYITFVDPADALNMSFLLINTALDFDDVTG